jgi:DNA-binding NarL/FixJ family response regulator
LDLPDTHGKQFKNDGFDSNISGFAKYPEIFRIVRMYSKRKNRIKSIEQLLTADPSGYTVADLSKRFGVTERMIFLDISQLRSTGSPIVGIPGPGGGIALDDYKPSVRETGNNSRETVEIFGYIDERRRLTELLRSASDGLTSTAIVMGEVGAGKSFITRDLVYQAEQSGFSVLTGNSLERSDSPSYWPWASVLDGLSGIPIPRAASTRFDRSIEILEKSFPIAAQSKRVRKGLRNALSGRDQLQIHEASRLVIETASHRKPILILLEDIHWADEASLELIHHLMQSIDSVPVLMVVTVRTPVEEVPDSERASLNRLLASSRGTTISLGSIKKHDAAQIMRSVSNGASPAAAVTVAYDLSGGNPFFMREISLLLNQRYDLESIEPDQQLDIPVSVKLAIEERLKSIEPAALPTLQLAAVLGRDVAVKELEAACKNMSALEPAAEISKFITAGVLAGDEQGGRVRFTHELIRQTVSESIEPSKLPAYHSAVARAIEQQISSRADRQPSQMARHFWISRSIDGQAKYAHYEVLAALEQMGSLTADDVMLRFETILEIPVDEIEPRDRAMAWLGLGKCRWLLSAGSRTTSNAGDAECFNNAFDGFIESDDIESALTVAADLVDYLDTNTADLLERADQLSDHSPSIGARIKLTIALASYFNANEQNAFSSKTLKELSRILYLARRNQDTDLEKEVLSNDARIRVDLLDLEAGIDRSLHYLAISEAQEQFADINDPHFQTCRAYASLGDLTLARAHAPTVSRISTSLEHNILTSQWHSMNWSLAICAGDWESASEVLPGMRQWAEDSHVTEASVDNSIRILQAYLDSMTSIGSELDESWYSLIELSSFPLPSTSDPAQIKAVIALRTGASLPMDLARNGLLLPPATNLNTAVRHMGPFHRLARNCALGIHAASTGDIDSATSLYQQLSPHAGIFGGILSTPLSVDRVLGLLAKSMGQGEVAKRHFADAVAAAENGGFQPEHAQALFDHAGLLLSDVESPDQHAAQSLLEKSKEIASSIQIRALVADCEQALSKLETPDSLSDLARFGLSSREEDVLKLIAEGMRNQEIAEQLYISINTVQHHVRNILRKTGATNRTGASSLVAVN